jgi:YVTN family beta-propeller protein
MIKKNMILGIFLISASTLARERLLVVNKDGNDVSILNTHTGATLATAKTGIGPHELAITPNNKKAIVTNYGYGCGKNAGSSLTVIDLQDYSNSKIDLGKYRAPHGIIALKDNKTVAVTVECSNALILVDIILKKVIKVIPTKSSVSHMLVLSKDEKLAFVANIGSGSVSVIDLIKGQLLKNITTGPGAEGIDITPDGQHIWVSNRASNSISVVNIKSLTITQTIKVGQMPIRIKFHPHKPIALVSNAKSATLAVINTQNYSLIKQIKMTDKIIQEAGNVFRSGPVPIGIAFSQDGQHAYVANTNVDEIRMIDLKEYQVKKILKAGSRPDGLSISR